MKILFFSHYFPPEGNAPASRTWEHCVRWVRAGHDVTVITCVPNVPNGVAYEGYRNRFRSQHEEIDGIHVIRVWTILAANAGFVLRILNYLSYLFSAVRVGLFVKRPDVIIATSPQFFCGWAGVLVQFFRRVPFILEIRDIWPESIAAVGAIRRGPVMRVLEWLERRMYLAADHIVAVGQGYRDNVLSKVDATDRISVIYNGVDGRQFSPVPPDPEFRAQHGLPDGFLCSYVGTIGMAHGLETVLDAVDQLKTKGQSDISFLMVGDGARREELQKEADRRGLTNRVCFTGRLDKAEMPRVLANSDALLVHLRDCDLFSTVIPSKIFEAMAMERPIIMGVRGESVDIVRRAGAGLEMEPGNAESLVDCVEKLSSDRQLRESLSSSGRQFVLEEFSRDAFAQQYLDLMQNVVRGTRPATSDPPPATAGGAAIESPLPAAAADGSGSPGQSESGTSKSAFRVGQFLRTVRHIPTRQLWLRLWLMIRRRVTMSPLGGRVRVRRRESLPLADELPEAVFPQRTQLAVQEESGLYLQQLGQRYRLDGEIDWGLTREASSTHLERLAFHYLEFLEALSLEDGERIVLDWIEQNPPWQPGYWLDSWNSYAVSIRTVSMMQWLAVHQKDLPQQTVDAVTGSVAEQLRFLVRNLELDIRGNHLIKNIRSLMWAGRFFAGAESAEWFNRGHALLMQELDAQFLDDGMHFELSPAYHCQVFADVLDCASLLPSTERQQLLQRLQPSAQAIADLTHPDGRISLFSDGGLNMAWPPEVCLDVYEQLGGPRPEVRDGFGLASSGYYGIRSSLSYLLLDCGPSCADSLPAHGHGDILAFEWDVAGQRVVVDAGVREYEAGPQRAWNRSTRAHNTVTVGDRDQCEFVKSFRTGHRAHGRAQRVDLATDSFSVTGCYTARSADGQQVTHTRTLSAAPTSVAVRDEVDSRTSEPAVARLLFHHDCDVTIVSDNCLSVAVNSTVIHIESQSPMRVQSAVWSPDFGTEYTTVQVEFDYGPTPCSGEFRLVVQDQTDE